MEFIFFQERNIKGKDFAEIVNQKFKKKD